MPYFGIGTGVQGVTYERYDCVITAVQKPAPGSDDEGKPDLISYTGEAVNTQSIARFVNVKPLRRISVGARIVPAEVGDPCQVVYVRGKMFLEVLEGILFHECEPSSPPPSPGKATGGLQSDLLGQDKLDDKKIEPAPGIAPPPSSASIGGEGSD